MSTRIVNQEISSSNFPILHSSRADNHLFVIVHGSELFLSNRGLWVSIPGDDIFFPPEEVMWILRLTHQMGIHCYALAVA